MGRKPKCRKFRTNRSGQQSFCISTIAPGRAGAAKHRTCESGHPWRSDIGVRVAPGAATELPRKHSVKLGEDLRCDDTTCCATDTSPP